MDYSKLYDQQKKILERRQTGLNKPNVIDGTRTQSKPYAPKPQVNAPIEQRAIKSAGGLVQGIFSSIAKRASNIGTIKKEANIRNAIGTPLFIAGEVAGGITDIGTEGLKAVFHLLPEDMQRKATQNIGGALEALGVPEAMKKYEEFATKHPEAAKYMEALMNIGSIYPVGKLGGLAKTATVKTAGTIAEKTGLKTAKNVISETIAPTLTKETEEIAKKAGVNLKDKAFQDALEITKPTYTPKAKEIQRSLGKTKEVGLLRTEEVMPTIQDLQSADAVKHLVVKKKPLQSIKNINNEISRISTEDIRPTIEANNGIFNKEQFKSALQSKIEQIPGYADDPVVKSAYDRAARGIMTKLEEQPKTRLGAYDARIAFDKDKAIFPKTGDLFRDTTHKAAARDIREMVNDFVEQGLPTESANIVRTQRSLQSKMFTARDNISRARTKAGKNVVQRTLKEHPWLRDTAKYAAGAAGATGVYEGFRMFTD